MKCRNSKKGNAVVDVLTVVVVLFIFAIISIVLNKSQVEINEDVQNSSDVPNMSKALMQQNTSDFPIIFDNIFIFIFVLLWIVALVASALTDTSYIFVIVAVLIMIVALIVIGSLSNAYEDLRTDADLISSGDMFPKTNFIFEHLGLFFTVFGFSVVIVMFGKGAG